MPCAGPPGVEYKNSTEFRNDVMAHAIASPSSDTVFRAYTIYYDSDVKSKNTVFEFDKFDACPKRTEKVSAGWGDEAKTKELLESDRSRFSVRLSRAPWGQIRTCLATGKN